MNALTLSWLNVHGCEGLDQVEFRYLKEKGLCCFAKKDFKKDDLIFKIPRNCIIGVNDAIHDPTISNLINSETTEFTGEFIIWLYMYLQNNDKNSHFYSYLQSLSTHTDLTSPCSWSADLIETLIGTNLEKQVSNSIERLNNIFQSFQKYLKASESITSDCDILVSNKRQKLNSFDSLNNYTIDHLMWAYSHYISRRYPESFALSYNKDYVSKFREQDFGNLGSMVPLLDILNHDPSMKWLDLIIDDKFLYVNCYTPISIDNEIYSNYGPLSNEILLFAYGFTIPNNLNDSVQVKLSTQNDSIGTFEIKGGLKGISKDLWIILQSMLYETSDSHINDENDDVNEIGGAECELLVTWIEKKILLLNSSNEKINNILNILEENNDIRAYFIRIYRLNQLKILTQTFEELETVLENLNQSEDDGEDNGEDEGECDGEENDSEDKTN